VFEESVMRAGFEREQLFDGLRFGVGRRKQVFGGEFVPAHVLFNAKGSNLHKGECAKAGSKRLGPKLTAGASLARLARHGEVCVFVIPSAAGESLMRRGPEQGFDLPGVAGSAKQPRTMLSSPSTERSKEEVTRCGSRRSDLQPCFVGSC